MADFAIHTRITAIRSRLGVSQRRLASTAGVSQSQLSRLESGELAEPTVTLLQAVCDAAGLPLPALVSDDETFAAALAALPEPTPESEDPQAPWHLIGTGTDARELWHDLTEWAREGRTILVCGTRRNADAMLEALVAKLRATTHVITIDNTDPDAATARFAAAHDRPAAAWSMKNVTGNDTCLRQWARAACDAQAVGSIRQPTTDKALAALAFSLPPGTVCAAIDVIVEIADTVTRVSQVLEDRDGRPVARPVWEDGPRRRHSAPIVDRETRLDLLLRLADDAGADRLEVDDAGVAWHTPDGDTHRLPVTAAVGSEILADLACRFGVTSVPPPGSKIRSHRRVGGRIWRVLAKVGHNGGGRLFADRMNDALRRADLAPHLVATLDELFDPETPGELRWTNGLVVLAGHTASGRSATAAAIYDTLTETGHKAHMLAEHIADDTPRPLGIATAMSEVSTDLWLRTVLHDDPDALVVDGLRWDDETAVHGLLRAALTGHLVFVTIHGLPVAGGELEWIVDRAISTQPPMLADEMRLMTNEVLRAVIVHERAGASVNRHVVTIPD